MTLALSLGAQRIGWKVKKIRMRPAVKRVRLRRIWRENQNSRFKNPSHALTTTATIKTLSIAIFPMVIASPSRTDTPACGSALATSAVDFDLDQSPQVRSYDGIMRCVLLTKRRSCVPSERDKLRPPKLVAFFFPLAGLFVAIQYERPFKLSITTFHVRVMAITPAIASHRVRHPS